MLETQSSTKSQSGQGLVEYGLILVLVSVVTVLFLMTMGGTTKNLLSNVAAGLGH
jgi:Flp pilus assembly pilin Flp